MTQNPYAGAGFDDAIAEPPRTSVMAVLSLVFSLIGCCLPIGLIGSLLGVFALIGISGSRGRVTGKGLAIAGIIIGIVFTAIWIGIYVAVERSMGVYSEMTGDVVTHIEAGDYTAARAAFDPATTITDEQFDAFRTAYTDELGPFRQTPQGFVEIIQTFMDPGIGQKMQDPNYQGSNRRIPIPGQFDQANALLLFDMNPGQVSPDGGPAFTDITVVLPDGTEIKLSGTAAASDTPDDGG